MEERRSKGTWQETLHRHPIVQGAMNALPIAIGYVPVAIAYGLLAKSAGLTLFITVFMSMAVYAGASQFLGVSLIGAQAGAASIIALTFFLNLRLLLMSTALSARLREPRALLRAIVAFGVTDESFSVASFRPGPLETSYLLTLEFVAYASWVAGSALGYLTGEWLPSSLQAGMGIALYAMFIGLLVPNARTSRTGLIVAVLAMLLNSGFAPLLGPGMGIVITAIIVSLAAALLDREERAEEAVQDGAATHER